MSAPADTRQFRARAQAAFKRANPGVTPTFTWEFSRSVIWADQTRGFSGVVAVSAEGYRTRRMVASFHDGAMSVR